MKKQGVNPTKHHSMKCPRLYGKKCTCDGYHTFNELYDHRIALFIALCNLMTRTETNYTQPNKGLSCWKSKLHSDGTNWEGWFIAGINTESGKQLSYHLPIDKWEELESYERDRAPKWDGHTPEDVIKRLSELV